jgi:uncharacterized membrane protein
MITTYSLLKLAHVVAVVLFLGNVTLGLFWVAHAERTRDPKLIGHAMAGIVRSDRWFTIPGVFLIIAGGVGAALVGGLGLMRTPWIAWGIAMFTLSGIVFGAVLAPLQKRVVVVAQAASVDHAALDGMLRRWHLWGWASVLPLWIAVAMMVLKLPS